MLRDLLGNVGLNLMATALAPDDQSHMAGECLPQRQRTRFALGSVMSHNPSMESDLSAEDKATIAALLREVIAADRFPLSPRIRSFRAILDKLDPPPVVETLPPPKPPGDPSWTQRKRR